jgi:hypothetical protein
MLVHLSVNENEIRIPIADDMGETVDRRRLHSSLATAAQVHEPAERADSFIVLEEMLVTIWIQRKEVEPMVLDEFSRLGKTGEGYSMAGSGQAPGELDTRIENTRKPTVHRENACHT